MAIDILGAGPAGLTAAINLARGGKKVSVFEKRERVGMRFPPNFQGLKYVDEGPEAFFLRMGVSSKIRVHTFPKVFFGTKNRDIEVNLGQNRKMPFVERGGKHSLEYSLYREAERLGVNFEFNSKRGETGVRIVATGGKGCDFAAVGCIFEDTDFPRDHYLVIFDDRYSPTGWYSYIIPTGKDTVEFVNCVSQPHIPNLAKLTAKALSERKILRDFLSGKKKLCTFGGSGTVSVPKTAFFGGRYYAGEAAGFQDPFMGFGIAHAVKSGKFAADSILTGSSYDEAWKREILPYMRKDLARRFCMSVFGDILPELFMGKHKNGDVVDVSRAAPEGFPFYDQAEYLLYLMERAKKGISGYW